nr:lysylphosphatidylglycerol synthase domain-containing protein [uncultured Flavobacterium sp.]
MISIPHKAKQFLVLLIKVLIVGGAFYFIYNQLANNDKLDWQKFIVLFQKNQSICGIIFILSLSVLNRYFEILKWQNLVSFLHKISVGEATKQVLGALTAGLFTPNGVGEYAGKALFFEKSNAKKIIFLNLICNGIQMILTIIFGFFGLLYFNSLYHVITTKTVLVVFGILILLFILLFSVKKITIKGYSLEKLIHKINEIPKSIHQKNIFLGICRYVVFSHQYYFLFLAFDVDLPYLTLLATITSVYFLASSLPTFQFLDFAVKGSVAVYFFGILGVNEWIVIFISTLMWFLNVVLPVAIGSYYVLNFKILSPPEASGFSKGEGDKTL